MKIMFPLIISSILISSCTHGKKQDVPSKVPIQNTINSVIKETKHNPDSFLIEIKDSSDYSSNFIKSLNPDKTFWKFSLDGNLLITNDQDTTEFPEEPPIDKVVLLSNKNDKFEINLTVKRVLLSTIEYKIELIERTGHSIIKSGSADLSSHFFLGSESDFDDSSGFQYFSAEYWDSIINYQTSIRIGKDPINNKSFLGKIICTLGNNKIDLDNFPTLIEKK